MEKFKKGLIIDGRKTAPAEIEIMKRGRLTSLKIKIHEGRNRQVRKMCAAINCNVVRLKRIAEGNLKLGNLERGKYRYLTDEEIKYLKCL